MPRRDARGCHLCCDGRLERRPKSGKWCKFATEQEVCKICFQRRGLAGFIRYRPRRGRACGPGHARTGRWQADHHRAEDRAVAAVDADRRSPGRHAAGTPRRSGRRAPGGARPMAGPRVGVRVKVRYARRPAKRPADSPDRITEGGHGRRGRAPLRHGAAVAWLEGQVHTRPVADLLGHSSIAVTGDIYGHTRDDTARAAVEGLAERLGILTSELPLPSTAI
jgi:hypothetical protein